MPQITDFSLKEFLKQENRYYTMFNQIKNRVKEIVQDFGMIEDGWHITDIDVYDDDFDEFYVHTTLKNKSGKQELFSIEGHWLYSDDYKERAEKVRQSKQAERDIKEYQEYLRLKAKFEKTT